MTRLLDQRVVDGLLDIVRARVDDKRELLRSLMWSATPPGMVELDTPEKVRVFTRYLSRQSEREQRGVVAGDLNQTLAGHPAMQEMAAESGDAMDGEAQL